MTVKEIREGITSGALTARSVVDACLDKIAKEDAQIGAFLEVYEGDARLRADEIDAALKAGEDMGPLAGVPVAIKDNILKQGRVASAGSRMLESYTAPYSATVVERLEAAGAIIVGRTNMDAFAQGSSTENSDFGITRNPHDHERVPGGTSGGSAAAVAAGFVPVALGSDTGGSVRNPAALCGLVGLKPTYGAVSRYGLIAAVSSFDQIGPLANTVEDAAEVMRVIAGEDARDATTRKTDAAMPELGPVPVKGLRIGVPKQFFNDALDKDVRSAVETALQAYASAGAELVEIDVSLFDAALAVYYIINPAEISSNMNRYDGLQYGSQVPRDTLNEQVAATRSDCLGDEVKRRILLGTFVLSSGYVDAYYKKAVAAQQALSEALEEAFKTVDVIMGPTLPNQAWKIGEKFEDPLTMYLTDIYTVIANMTGVPAISVPCQPEGQLPIGLQVMGKKGSDAQLLDLAYWWQEHGHAG